MSSPVPDLSIVIPTCNRVESIAALVDALLAEEHPGTIVEIVVVIHGLAVSSAESLAALGVPAGTELRVESIPHGGLAAARNLGVARSSGRFVLFLDEDVLPGGPLLAEHAKAQESADVVLGRIVAGENTGGLHVFRSLDCQFHQERHKRLAESNGEFKATDVSAANLSVSRALLDQIGGFDAAFPEPGVGDWDLGQRLLDTGATFAYAPEAVVSRNSIMTSADWLLNAREEAAGQKQLVEKFPKLITNVSLGGLHEEPIGGRAISQFGVQFPRLAQHVGTSAMRAVQAVDPLPLRSFSRRVAGQSRQLHFWSSVRDSHSSAREAREQLEFHARILCYHRITDHPNPALAEYAIRPETFRRQMRWLRDHGWTVLRLSEMLDAFGVGRPLHKAVVITFDDGYQDLVDHAMPILQEFGFTATAYVVSSLFGKTAEWDTKFGGDMGPLVTLEGIAQLEAAGWEIGHHTRTHPNLTRLDEAQLADEIVRGKQELEKLVGHPVPTFAYPFGLHNARVREISQQAGFSIGMALEPRVASGRSCKYAMERVCVLHDHTLLDFQSLLWFGRDLSGSVRHVADAPARILAGPPPLSDSLL